MPEPSAEQLESLLRRETAMPAKDIARFVQLLTRDRRVRLSEMDRRFAQRALARCRRVKP